MKHESKKQSYFYFVYTCHLFHRIHSQAYFIQTLSEFGSNKKFVVKILDDYR